jgi:hypothetical protein
MLIDVPRERAAIAQWWVALALLGLATIEALVAVSVYTNLASLVAVVVAGAGVLYLVSRRPTVIVYVALGWMVLEKSVEPHLPIDPTKIDTMGDILLVVALAWTILLNLLRRREPAFTMGQIGAPLVAFVALGVVSTILNSVPFHVAELGILSTTHSMFIFLVLVNAGIAERDIYRFVYIAIGVMAVDAVGAILQIVPSSPAWKLAPIPLHMVGGGGLLRVQGIFDHPNALADFTVLVLPISLMLWFRGDVRGHKHLFLLAANLVMLGALLLTQSREAWAALLIATVFLGLTVERTLLRAFIRYILPSLVVLGLIFAPLAARVGETITHSNLRYALFQASLPLIRDHPWLGVGPGRFGGHVALITHTPLYREYNFPNFFYGTGGQLDQFWTHLLGESGVLGTAAYLGTFVACFLLGRWAYKRAVDPRRKAVLLGLLYAIPAFAFVALVSAALETGPPATFFWGLMGMLTVLANTPDLNPHVEGAYDES